MSGRPGPGRPGPCRHCERPIVYDPQGRPIHTSLEYACRDRWGLLTDTHAEPAPVVGRVAVTPPCRRPQGR